MSDKNHFLERRGFSTAQTIREDYDALAAENKKLRAAHEHLSIVDKRSIGDVMIENGELRRVISELVEALQWIVDWGDKDDEVAREVLAKHGGKS